MNFTSSFAYELDNSGKLVALMPQPQEGAVRNG